MPNQFENPANPRYHHRVTGPELWQQMQGRIDAFVWASGTGGSISGIGRYLKEQSPAVRIVDVEPARSAVINGFERGAHKFQGMGPGFLPKNLDLALLDACAMVFEEDAFPLARRLASEEGIFVGMSSGAAVFAALQVARRAGAGEGGRDDGRGHRRPLHEYRALRLGAAGEAAAAPGRQTRTSPRRRMSSSLPWR